MILKSIDNARVSIYLAANGLELSASAMGVVCAVHEALDAQYSAELSARIRRGQMGRFLAGHVGGGGTPYGFCRIRHENVDNHGSNAANNVEWAIDPEQAAVVVQIFEAYAAGFSYAAIARKLNDRGVKPPNAPRPPAVRSWSKSAVLTILRNERYIGVFRWNQSIQLRHPITGKLERRVRRESEWSVKELPDLRIVPQELWDRVCEQRRFRSKNFRRLGGIAKAHSVRNSKGQPAKFISVAHRLASGGRVPPTPS